MTSTQHGELGPVGLGRGIRLKTNRCPTRQDRRIRFRVESVLCGRGRWPKFANYALLKEGALRPATAGQEAMDREERSVHDWRVSQLTRLGIPGPPADVYADRIDWHQIARLVQRGCPPQLALRIAG